MATQRTLGKYRIIAELGHGGMADVYLAIVAGPSGSGFTKLAVVKRLRPNLVEEPEFVAMLVDEARISARLNHPNVVQTLEVGMEGEEYYLAMEFLDGQPLHRIQRRAQRAGTPLTREIQYLVIADTLAGMHHAHELADYDGSPLGIVHRDINPQNIFVTYEGLVKVVDFGIAKAAGRAAETKQGIVKGKVRYMSPEQAMGHAIDRRADVFAAGLLLWEAATGRHFWQERDDLAILQRLLAGEYDASPRSIDETVPPAIDAICRKAMAFDVADRYATAADFRDELETFLAGSITSARKQLGPRVASLFDAERKKVRAVIEQARRVAIEPSNVARLALSEPVDGSPMDASSSSPISISPVVTSSLASPSGQVDAMRAPRNPRGRALAGAVGAIAAIALVVVASVGMQLARVDASSGGGMLAPRAATQLAGNRIVLELSSGAAKALALHPVPPPAGTVTLPSVVTTPAAHGAALLAAAPAPAIVTRAPTTAGAAVGTLPVPPRRRPTASLDMSDPWKAPSGSN